MSKPVTLTDIARRLDVHPTTVSMALRKRPEISNATQRRVEALAKRLGYQPNLLARSLRQRSTKTLGAIFPCMSLPYYASMLDALQAEARSRGLCLEVQLHLWSAIQEEAAVRTLIARRVDGLILYPASGSTLARLRRMAPTLNGLPVAAIGRPPLGKLTAALRGCVATDIQMGGRLLGAHLAEAGHRHIALLAPERHETINLTLREAGLREGLKSTPGTRLQRVDLTGKIDLTSSFGDEQSGFTTLYHIEIRQRLTEVFLRLTPRPTAVVASDDLTAHVLLSGLHARGIRVPEDLSVACFNDTLLSAFGLVPLTCVAHPIEPMASRLIELVTAPLHSRDRVELRLLPTKLVLRSSVAHIGEPAS